MLEQALPFDFESNAVCDSVRANTDAACHERRAHTFMLALAPADGDAPARVLVRMLCQMPDEQFGELDNELPELQDNVNDAFVEQAQLDPERAYWPVQMAAELDPLPEYWTHFLVSHDGKMLSLYINGSHAVSTATPGPFALADQLPFYVAGAAGANDDGTSAPSTFDAFDGEIKRLDFMSESLDAAQANETASDKLAFERIDDRPRSMSSEPSDALSGDGNLSSNNEQADASIVVPMADADSLLPLYVGVGVASCIVLVLLVVFVCLLLKRRREKHEVHVRAYLETQQERERMAIDGGEVASMHSVPSRQVSHDNGLAPPGAPPQYDSVPRRESEKSGGGGGGEYRTLGGILDDSGSGGNFFQRMLSRVSGRRNDIDNTYQPVVPVPPPGSQYDVVEDPPVMSTYDRETDI